VWKWIELKETIQQADRSLYTSKNSGRNQIHYAEVL
jgi:PleD family two-component response regulator